MGRTVIPDPFFPLPLSNSPIESTEQQTVPPALSTPPISIQTARAFRIHLPIPIPPANQAEATVVRSLLHLPDYPPNIHPHPVSTTQVHKTGTDNALHPTSQCLTQRTAPCLRTNSPTARRRQASSSPTSPAIPWSTTASRPSSSIPSARNRLRSPTVLTSGSASRLSRISSRVSTMSSLTTRGPTRWPIPA